MSSAELSAAPARQWRATAARWLYAIAFTWIVAGLALYAFGLRHFTVPGFTVSITRLDFLRPPLLLLSATWFFDPDAGLRLPHARAFLDARWKWLWPAALGAIALNLAAFKVFQHLAFLTNGWDLMVFESALHNTLRGRFMWAYGLERSLFGDHFEPLLLALVPIYGLLPSPLTLMVIQGLAVAAACVPLFLTARAHELPRSTAALLVFLFLSSRYLWTAFGFDFHVELFTPLFLFAAFLALAHRRWPLFYAALVGALCIKEDMGLALVSIALLVAIRRRSDWRHALATGALGLCWTAVAIAFVIPAFDVGSQGQSFFLARYAHLGSTHREVAFSLLNPMVTLKLLTGAPVRELVLRLGLLPLLDPGLCVSLVPPLLVHLASGFSDQYLLEAHYALPGFSVALAALPLALQRAAKLHRRLGQVALAVAVIVFNVAEWRPHRLAPRTTVGRELLAQVPPDAHISAQNSLVPQLVPSMTLRPYPHEAADWVLLDLEGDHYPLGNEEYEARALRLLEEKQLGVVQWREGFLFLQRGAPVDRNDAVLEELRRRFAR